MRRLLPLILLAAAPAVAARADDCAAPLAAAVQLGTLPYRMHLVTTSGTDALRGGKPEEGDLIATADKTYVELDGTWHASEREADSGDDMKAAIAEGKVTCSYLRDETVDGEATAVYHVLDAMDEESPQDETLWVSKATGLLVRLDSAVDVGGDAGKSTTTATFDYKDVKAPADAQ
ncbi:MAG: hypothetical protein U1E34_06350 [Amaricoccus sp.]